MAERTTNPDVSRLLRLLRTPESYTEEENWLRDQLKSAGLQDGLRALGSAVFSEQLCGACSNALAYYVHLKVVGDDAEAEYPQVKPHLDLCPSCSAAYDELYTMVSAAYADEVPVAPSYPALDLSFLSESRRTPGLQRSTFWESISSAGQEVSRLSSVIRVVIYHKVAHFGELSYPLFPTWVAVPITRDGTTGVEERAQVLPLPCPEHDLSISLTIGPVSDEQAAIGVEVAKIASEQPLSRVRITLLDENRRLLASEMTRGDGRVIFRNIGTGKYSVEVKHQDKIWVLPLAFVLEEEIPGET